MNILNLFPVPIALFNIDHISKTELDFLHGLETRKNVGNKTSLDTYLFKHKELTRIYNFCLNSLQEYLKNIYNPSNPKLKLKITQSWANFTSSGQFHHSHTHTNSVVSGVLYVQTNPNIDRIIFSRNQFGSVFSIDTNEYNIYNSEQWGLPVSPKQLILFPSILYHQVDTRPENDEVRISLSFNSYLSGRIGNPNKLNELLL